MNYLIIEDHIFHRFLFEGVQQKKNEERGSQLESLKDALLNEVVCAAGSIYFLAFRSLALNCGIHVQTICSFITLSSLFIVLKSGIGI
jgi:hypothetical protein